MGVQNILGEKGNVVFTISMNSSIEDAVKLVNEKRIGAIIVMDDDKLQGIITERDILKNFLALRNSTENITVKQIMTPREKLIIATKDDDIQYLMNVMTKNKIRHLPVMDKEKLVGVISIRDIVKSLLSETTYENKLLKDYISGKYPG
ncbi:MAG: CBS domain-containing protein [Spirochaeta sp.]|nr:CBS domain-containing protein [Spirochaeta sp.]